MSRTELSSWNTLKRLSQNPKQLLEDTKDRIISGEKNLQHIQFESLTLDISKNLLNDEILSQLKTLTEETKLSLKKEHLFSSFKINTTENRSAGHWLLRGYLGKDETIRDRVDDVQNSLQKMENMVAQILSGNWRGFSGKAITDVVNLGVGGSELGPLMANFALSDFNKEAPNPVDIHFASSIDGSQLSLLLNSLNPETTLFILASKSFTTIDTFSNAETAKKWMSHYVHDQSLIIKQHFIGISASQEKMDKWGLPSQNQLLFWEWVGGRYSLWSTIGFPIALKVGMEGFKQMLAGAHAMDVHFYESPFEKNLPVLLAMVGIWNINFLGINQHTILPYDGRFKYFPQYLQQLEMESNGKSVTADGQNTSYDTCPVIWGDVGPNAQHAFYQLLHQGTQQVSCDFIAVINRYDNIESEESRQDLKYQQQLSLANCLAQSRVLLLGDRAIDDQNTNAEVPDYKKYPGRQPSTTLLIEELTPYSLGQLVALYEHKVFVQSVIWNINPFDQWGVELGKVMAKETLTQLNQTEAENEKATDASTSDLIALIQKSRAVKRHGNKNREKQS